MLASSISQGSGAGWPGVLCRAPHGLQLGFGCQVICVLLILSDNPRCDFYSRPTPPSCCGNYVVSTSVPLTCRCDGAWWVAAAHRVVMDTLRVQLGLICGLTLLSRHHSPSLSIVDEFNFIKRPTPTNPLMCSPHKYNQIFVAHLVAKLTGFQCAYQQL